MRITLFALLFTFLSLEVNGQCTITVNSTDGYQVHITLTPVAIILSSPPPCPYGYNFNVSLQYNVSFSGSNIPSGLYTLQAQNFYCGAYNFGYFPLPVAGGSGLVTTTGNLYRTQSDCATISINDLTCSDIDLLIQGPGIPTQNVSCNLLPIELLHFSASEKGTHVELSWTTASETNNDLFTIERSRNGVDWEQVTEQKGAGTSFQTLSYTAVDPAPYSGDSYYRLKQTDFDGQFSYSDVETVEFQYVSNARISVYPNPTANLVTVSGAGPGNEKLRVYNKLGQEVSHLINILENGDAQRVLDLSNLPSGIYFLQTGSTVNKLIYQP